MRAPRATSEERQLLDLHRADANYAKTRTKLTLLFGRATSVLVNIPKRNGQQRNVTLTTQELGLLNDVLRFDESMVIE
jgi:hypothetical protein